MADEYGEWKEKGAHLRLTRYRRNVTNPPTLQRVNHTALPHIRVPNKPNRDLLLVPM
jgi:hypothetical protein